MPTATSRLSPRETETLRAIARGQSTAEIARHLHVTKSTIRTYIRGIYQTLGVATREDAVRTGRRLGIVTDACPTCGRGGRT